MNLAKFLRWMDAAAAEDDDDDDDGGDGDVDERHHKTGEDPLQPRKKVLSL